MLNGIFYSTLSHPELTDPLQIKAFAGETYLQFVQVQNWSDLPQTIELHPIDYDSTDQRLSHPSNQQKQFGAYTKISTDQIFLPPKSQKFFTFQTTFPTAQTPYQLKGGIWQLSDQNTIPTGENSLPVQLSNTLTINATVYPGNFHPPLQNFPNWTISILTLALVTLSLTAFSIWKKR